MTRWLGLYEDRDGKLRAAMITPADPCDFPFGVNPNDLNLADYDGNSLALVEMPDDAEFRPMVVDLDIDAEMPMQFIDLK